MKKLSFWCLLCPLASLLVLFGFFQGCIPYTLFHREQYSLFLWNGLTLKNYLQDGGLARFLGDFLTQFYYYVYAAPVILAVVLTLLGFIAFILFRRVGTNILLGSVLAIAVVAWETGRECLPDYPLASTFSVIGYLALLLCVVNLFHRRWIYVAGLLFSLSLTPLHILDSHIWGKPDFALEHLMAVDTEAYWGHWNRVQELTSKDIKNETVSYYHNLSRAMNGQLPEKLMQFYQPFERGLFLPVNDKGNYFQFTAAGEAWYQLGETTMAEHAAMLGMLFSPQQTGTRSLRRMAEINLLNGDREAAAKYLRMLKQTIPHRKWAEMMSNEQSPTYQKLMQKRNLLAQKDIIHWTTDYASTLRNLLDENPSHVMARDYLLCFDLLTKNLAAFVQDYVKYGQNSAAEVYLQALLIVSATHPEDLEPINVAMPQKTVQNFQRYNQIMNSPMATIQKEFGDTYWFYYQFAKRNGK